MPKIAIFASGAGTNALKLIEHFKNHPSSQIALIGCNKPHAGVMNIAIENQIPILPIEKEIFFRGDGYVPQLQAYGIDWIILAGFLWKIPKVLIDAYPSKIINIHPALLPKFGGKGMYGMHVHEAVVAQKEQVSGITIHLVDEVYDHGQAIFQATCSVLPNDTALAVSKKVQVLEHLHFAKVVDFFIHQCV